MKERGRHFDLIFNVYVGMRFVLLERKSGTSFFRFGCEAGSKQDTSLSGFAVGGISRSNNRDMQKFDLFAMRAKFALLLYNVSVYRKSR